MADSNININVSANTSGAVSSLQRLTTTMNSINSSIEKTSKKMYNFGHTIQEFGHNMYSIGQRATIGISLPLAGGMKKIVETGASMKAMHNTFKVVFGNTANQAQQWSQKLSKSVGLSSGIIDKTNLNFRKMAGAFGLTGKEALDFSSKWTKLTLDLSAFNDIPIDEATERMMSGLRGEADAVERLGIFMGEANIKAQMLSMGIDGQYSKLSQTKKMQVLYALALKQTSQASGQAQREAESYQNSMANLKQNLAEFAEKVFVVIEPTILDTIKTLNKFIDKLKELSPEQVKFYTNLVKWGIILPPIIMYVGATIEGLGRIFKVLALLNKLNFANAFLKLGSALETVYIYGLYVADFFAKLGGWLATAGSAIGGVLTTIAGAIGVSVGALIAIIVGIAVAVFLLIKYWDEIKAWTIKVWGEITAYLSEQWTSIKELASSTWSSFSTFFSDIWNSIKETTSSIWDGIVTSLSAVWQGIIELFNSYVRPIVDPVVSAFKEIWAGIQEFVQGVIVVLTAFGDFFAYVWNDLILPILQYVGGFFKAFAELVVWCIQQGIGLAIIWLADKWNWLYTNVITPIGTAICAVFTSIGQFFTDMYTNYILPAVESIKAGWNNLSSACMSLYNVVVNTVINGIKAGWQGLCSVLNAVWNQYGVPVINSVKSVANTVASAWNSALNRAKSIFQSFANSVSSAWRSLMSAFKLPHLSVQGGWDLTPPSISVPKLSVDWYAKGGLFNSASVIGVGEAGSEAVLPLTNKRTMSMIGSTIATFMPDNKQANIKEVGSNVVINVDGLVVREEADVEKIGQHLYKLQQRELRRRGRSDV